LLRFGFAFNCVMHIGARRIVVMALVVACYG
jgi:hypothetical protein